MTVRLATLDDIPALAALGARLARIHHAYDAARFFLPSSLEEGYQRFYTGELANPKALLLTATEVQAPRHAIVGYVYGCLEPRNWNLLLDDCGKLHDLFVDDSARHKGVGKALVRAAVDHLRDMGASQVVLYSATQNSAMQRLATELGFRTTMVEMSLSV